MSTLESEVVSTVEVCAVSDLAPEVGVRALVGGQQVAVFLMPGGDIFALGAIDPFSGSAVLSRGIVGDLQGEMVVASPIYKQHFRLADGVCLEDESVSVPVFDVRVVDGTVLVSTSPRSAS